MAEQGKNMDRRNFVKLAGASALVVPLAGLTACGDKPASTSSAPAADARPADKPAAQVQTTAADTRPAMEAKAPDTSAMPRIEESDPLAQALGYKHNVADIDAGKYPQRRTPEAANQFCKNCVLYTGADGAEWGPCTIFPGKQVNAMGWCASYALKG